MKQTYFLLLLFLAFVMKVSFAQEKKPVSVTYSFPNKTDSNFVSLVVENHSKKQYYYSISLGALIDGHWKPLLSDINSLGQNEFVALKPLKGKSKIVKQVSVNEIYSLYKSENINRIRFGVMFYEKKDFHSKGDISYTSPI